MDELRVLLVTRRFWPLCDDSVGRLAALAEGLRRRGAQPTVLAARYANAWPAKLWHREVPVERAAAAPRGEWSAALYQRQLARWLRERCGAYDVLYADAMREEASVVVSVARAGGPPAVVRCGGWGAEADWRVAQASRSSRRALAATVQGAAALIAPSAEAARQLIAAGADRRRVHRLDDGIPAPIRRDDATRRAARAALAECNSDLVAPPGTRVVLCIASMSPSGGAEAFAAALPPLLAAVPEARIWMIGDGPQRVDLYQQLRSVGLGGGVAMPGSFDHCEELLQAADLFVVPSASDGLEHFFPSALAAAIPCVAIDQPEVRAVAGPAQAAIQWAAQSDPIDLAQRIEQVLGDLETWERGAVEARRRWRPEDSRQAAIDALLVRMTAVAGRGPASPSLPSAPAHSRTTGAGS